MPTFISLCESFYCRVYHWLLFVFFFIYLPAFWGQGWNLMLISANECSSNWFIMWIKEWMNEKSVTLEIRYRYEYKRVCFLGGPWGQREFPCLRIPWVKSTSAPTLNTPMKTKACSLFATTIKSRLKCILQKKKKWEEDLLSNVNVKRLWVFFFYHHFSSAQENVLFVIDFTRSHTGRWTKAKISF